MAQQWHSWGGQVAEQDNDQEYQLPSGIQFQDPAAAAPPPRQIVAKPPALRQPLARF